MPTPAAGPLSEVLVEEGKTVGINTVVARIDEAGLNKAREYNAQRYYYQGIGRYDPDAAMARGLADLEALAALIPPRGYLHSEKPTSIDAGIYGFIANIYFYDINTPLKQLVTAHENIVRHCRAIHETVKPGP